jgi:hypothetical protein
MCGKTFNEDLGTGRGTIVEATIELLRDDLSIFRHKRFCADGKVEGFGVRNDWRPPVRIPVAMLNLGFLSLRLYGLMGGNVQIGGPAGQTDCERQNAQKHNYGAPQQPYAFAG